MRSLLLICWIALLSLPVGCAGGTLYPTRSSPANRGLPMEGFDPYPEDRTAPAIEGARPPGFEHPMSEPERVRRKPWLVDQ